MAQLSIIMIAIASVLMAIHGGRLGGWPWGIVASLIILIVADSRGLIDLQKTGLSALLVESKKTKADGAEHMGIRLEDAGAQEVVDLLGATETFQTPQVQQYIPYLYSVERLQEKHQWLRGDRHLAEALLHLRTYRLTDGHTVRTILQLLGEFYRRYGRMLNRPWVVHLSNEYTILHDIAKSVLNTVHELHFSRPPMLNNGLDIVTREILSRTSRMLRVLRHKYPNELKGTAMTVAGPAPRAHDPYTPESPGNRGYQLFV